MNADWVWPLCRCLQESGKGLVIKHVKVPMYACVKNVYMNLYNDGGVELAEDTCDLVGYTFHHIHRTQTRVDY